MAKARQTGLSTTAMLKLATGFFFVVLGISGVLPSGEGLFSLSRDRTTLEIVFGVMEILCGGFIIVENFRRFPAKTTKTVLLVILCLWVLRIAITQFVQGVRLSDQGILFLPSFWSWLFSVSVYLLVATNLWILYSQE